MFDKSLAHFLVSRALIFYTIIPFGKIQSDIVLMYISMLGVDGLDATRQIKPRWPDMNIVVLKMRRSEEHFFEMF